MKYSDYFDYGKLDPVKRLASYKFLSNTSYPERFQIKYRTRVKKSGKTSVKKYLVLDSMGVVFINEDDVEELFIPFLKKRFKNLNVEKLRSLYYNLVSLGKISSKEFFKRLYLPNIEREYLDKCLRIDPDFKVVGRTGWDVLKAIFESKKLVKGIREFLVHEGVVDCYKEYVNGLDLRRHKCV